MTLRYLPEAVPTALGWAHPLTGEQLDVTSGLDNPVEYYKPNARGASFLDPDGEIEFLGFSVVKGRKARLAIHTLHPIVNVEWDFDDESDMEIGSYSVVHVFPVEEEDATYNVSGTVTYLVEGEDGSEEETEVVTIEVLIPGSSEGSDPEPQPEIPENTLAPVVTSDDLVVGTVLTATAGEWTGEPTLAYQWQTGDGTDFTDIDGEVGESYTLLEDDVGAHIRVVETATNDAGSDSAESDAVGPVVEA